MGTKYVVRYGAMRVLGHFDTANGNGYSRGSHAVIRTERGLEVGEILCPAGERTAEFLTDTQGGQLLRVLSPDDERELLRIRDGEKTEFDTARRMVVERKLQMELVDIEHLFGGDRVVLYYLAEKRVDFREFVKSLAGEFQTRVEMRQIGVRDEAKLLADYGDCGKPVCCNTHLAKMPPVSMKMAKLQKSTLDPTKISGRCGRLKCCLRYEYDTYEEYQRELPPVGSRVVTRSGTGFVLAQEVLARRVLVEFEDRRRVPVPINDVMTVLTGGRQKGSERERDAEQGAEEPNDRTVGQDQSSSEPTRGAGRGGGGERDRGGRQRGGERRRGDGRERSGDRPRGPERGREREPDARREQGSEQDTSGERGSGADRVNGDDPEHNPGPDNSNG